MKRHHPPSGLNKGLELLIDPHGSPEQAMAVFELLDDLRDLILAHYELALVTKFNDERICYYDVVSTDPPF